MKPKSVVLMGLLSSGFFSMAPTVSTAEGMSQDGGLRFEISFEKSLHHGPLTGRLFLAVSPTEDPVPRIAAYNSARRRDGRMPFFAVDIEGLTPGEPAVVDATAVGYPLWSLNELPAGDYYVQAVLHVYTEFRRSDGHVVWAPMDQWEGQRWAFSPGNVVSKPKYVHLDRAESTTVSLELDDKIPPLPELRDTEWVKRVKFQSKLLTAFWGHPIYIGATVLLPQGYDDNLEVDYPVVYQQNHFSLSPAFGFTTEPPEQNDLFQDMMEAAGGKMDTGYDFYKAWSGDSFPRMLAITFQHPTPYFDDSYGVNSVNNGPYGDALLTELIPYLEKKFRIIAKPYARVLTGGSTGGWMSLALQVYHPKFFGGTWTFFPDPIDFRRYQLINIYEDANAFVVPDSVPGAPERMFQRTTEGQPVGKVRQISQLELAQGTKGRSGGQLDIWNAAYGPIGDDGYPRLLWDKKTGKIDHEVAEYMRDKGYDLRHYTEKNWSTIGPDLVGKIRLYNPEMDQFYLPYAVYLMEDFLEDTRDPYYGGEVIHGRPKKGHGWRPTTNAELIQKMAEHIMKNAPAGSETSGWMER